MMLGISDNRGGAVTNFYVNLSFWPVGQGLFSSGHIKIDERLKSQQNEFYWIYDCCSSKKENLYKAIGLYNESNTSDLVDVMAISHFDKDHMNGLIELLENKKIRYLLLPYMPLWQRLMIAIQTKLNLIKDEDRDFFTFLIDPVSYLAEKYGQNGKKIKNAIEEIIFVLSEHDVCHEEKDNDGARVQDNNGESLQFYREHLIDPDFTVKGIKTTSLKYGTSMIFENIWEFIPYNDAGLTTKIDNHFKSEIEEFIKSFKNNTTTLLDNKNAILNDLKSQYTQIMKKINFNKTSLFLYAGPAIKSKNYYVHFKVDYENYKSLRKISSYIVPDDLGNEFLWSCFSTLCFEPKIGKSSVLYTGNGVLNSFDKYERMEKHFNAERMKKIAIFQVMHHGSRYHWYLGLADQIAPKWSVFSANPKIGEHYPHSDVLHDFVSYQPTLVNQQQGAYFVISTW